MYLVLPFNKVSVYFRVKFAYIGLCFATEENVLEFYCIHVFRVSENNSVLTKINL